MCMKKKTIVQLTKKCQKYELQFSHMHDEICVNRQIN